MENPDPAPPNAQQARLEDLQAQEQKLKKEQITSAFLIGFACAPPLWSLYANGFGFKLLLLALLPVFFIVRSRSGNAALQRVREQLKALTPWRRPVQDHAIACLNCGHPVTGKYCAHCGQKTSTHRYSFGHFLTHDLVHGIWHLDNGILFTLKALFTRPGHSVREYLAGRRVGFFNFFTLLLILIGVGHFLNSYTTVKMADLMGGSGRAVVSSMEAFMEKYPKASLVATIPVYALFSFVWFRKARFNLTEHFVLNSYKTAAESVFNIAYTLLTICYPNRSVLAVFIQLLSLVSAAYAVVFYYQFFSQSGYSRKALIWRSIAVPVTYMLFYVVVGIVVAAVGLKRG